MNASILAPTSARTAAPLVGSILIGQIALWIFLFGSAGLFRDGPNGKSLGTDFAVFSGASAALEHGENPYDYRVLYRYERQLLRAQHLAVTSQVQNVRAGNPPLFYWALGPLQRLPFTVATVLWIAAMYVCAALGFLAALRYLNWTSRLVPVLIFLLMPQVVLGACYGNIHAPVFAAITLGLLLAERNPTLAGIVLAPAWLKPQLALPAVALIALFHTSHVRRLLAGFATVSLMLTGATIALLGANSLLMWLHGLTSWSHTVGLEPNLASAVGVYVPLVSYNLRILLGAGLFLAASGATGLVWWRRRGRGPASMHEVSWLWISWFLVAPFAHFPDEILLTVPVVALMGRNATYLARRGPAIGLVMSFLSVLLYPSWFGNVNLLALVVAGLGIYAFTRSREFKWQWG